MKKGTVLNNYPTCARYSEYMKARMAHSTVRGYISALNSSLVNNLLKTIITVESVFEIEDTDVLARLIQLVSKNDINKNSHSRYTAALRSYHQFICNQTL